LLPGRGKVDYCQPSMPKTDARFPVDPDSVVIGTAVPNRFDHSLQQRLINLRASDQPGYAAHRSVILRIITNVRPEQQLQPRCQILQ
jgi:hypothetical protein